jgi:hypothetical protein
MKTKNNFLTGLGLILFFVGALIGILFFAGLVWPSLEANFYFGYNGGADTKLRLICPRILTPADNAVLTAVVTNKTDRTISPKFEAQISGPIIQTIRTTPAIEAGQTVDLRWEVNGEDVAFGHLIMTQVYQFAAYKTPTATSTCGSLYLFIPWLAGNVVYVILFILSMALIIAGILLWRVGRGQMLTGLDQEQFTGMLILGATVLVGILIGTAGQWILGLVVLVLAVVMFAVQVSPRLSGA